MKLEKVRGDKEDFLSVYGEVRVKLQEANMILE